MPPKKARKKKIAAKRQAWNNGKKDALTPDQVKRIRSVLEKRDASGLRDLALFLGLIWRSFHISRLAADAGLKFPSYLAAGFGLWIGIQAFINIGVNMGVLPTKGLTLPLMSYGRSSLIVALAWTGLLLRVYHEAMREQRGSATVRGAT